MFPDFSSPYRLEPPSIYDRRAPMSPYTTPSYPPPAHSAPSLVGGPPSRSPPLPHHHNYQHSSPWYNVSADHNTHSLGGMAIQRHSPPYNLASVSGAYSYQDPLRNNYLATCQQQTITPSSPHQLNNRDNDLVSPISLSPRTPTHTFSPPGGSFQQHM